VKSNTKLSGKSPHSPQPRKYYVEERRWREKGDGREKERRMERERGNKLSLQC